MDTTLTDGQKLFLHDCLVAKDMLADYSLSERAEIRTELIALGLLEVASGHMQVTDDGLRALDNFTAREVLAARLGA